MSSGVFSIIAMFQIDLDFSYPDPQLAFLLIWKVQISFLFIR